jgi:TonB family protein
MGAFRKLHPSVALSILLHGVVIALVAVFAIHSPAPSPHVSRPIMIEMEALPSRDTLVRDQVVQSEKGQASQDAAEDAFLGERTQVVEKQVVSMPKTGTAPQASVAGKKAAQPSEGSSTDSASPSRSLIRGTGALAKFGIAISANEADSPKPKTRDVVAEASMDAQVRGEYVKGFKEGESTLLNTREYVFYGYFQRIRESLDRAWERSLREQLTKYFHRGRQLASEQDYMTQILVSLDSGGQVTRVQIIGASGTKDLDDAAVRAFNDAGPFPNPPKGLVDESGQVFVRWDFVLKT